MPETPETGDSLLRLVVSPATPENDALLSRLIAAASRPPSPADARGAGALAGLTRSQDGDKLVAVLRLRKSGNITPPVRLYATGGAIPLIVEEN